MFFLDPATGRYGRPWSYARVQRFEEWQWKCLAPIFSGIQSHLALCDGHILPFTGTIKRGGSGTFGAVHECIIHPAHDNRDARVHKADGRVAIKKLNGANNDDEIIMNELNKAWQQEVTAHQVISKAEHPNIIKFITAIAREQDRYLVFEWANGGNLREFWKGNEPRLTIRLVKDVINQLYGLAGALEQMHGEHFRHGDVKPENILRVKTPGQKSGSVELDIGIHKICDMGLTKYHEKITQLRNQPTNT
ncbi:unnamed protein product [Discula destructiva]